MENAVKFLIYSLAIAVLALAISIDKTETMQIVLGIALVVGFTFSYFAIKKICLREDKKQNSRNSEEL